MTFNPFPEKFPIPPDLGGVGISREKGAGWVCLTCDKWQVEGGAGYQGAVEMGARHIENNEGHEVIAWTWTTARVRVGIKGRRGLA